MAKRYDNEKVLVFSDPHYPYQHKDTFQFLEELNEHFQPDRVVCLGDLLDLYSVSSYPKDPDHKDSWSNEIKKARKQISKLAELFPVMDVMSSNHDDRVSKRSRLAGVPREFMVPYRDVIGAPEGWKWHDELSITVDSTRDKLFFAHTKTGGAAIAARDKGCSTFLGHQHSKFGATAFKPFKNKTIWGVDVGCLISDKGSPYKYNKADRGRPIQGAVIVSSGQPDCILL